MASKTAGMSRFGEMSCPIARTMEVVGERWTPLILRDIHRGITRFDAIQASLGIPRKLLTERLATLEGHGVIERVPYQGNPPRYDYRFTQKGRDLKKVLWAMLEWGLEYGFEDELRAASA